MENYTGEGAEFAYLMDRPNRLGNAPEIVVSRDDRQLLRAFATAQGAAFLQAVAASAGRLRSWIALGGVARCGARWFNRTLVFDPAGDLAFTYDKVHLTDVEKNDLGLTCGAMPRVFEQESLRIGFATCFDLYCYRAVRCYPASGHECMLKPSGELLRSTFFHVYQ